MTLVNRQRCVERMVALELHSPALERAFEMPLIHLDADESMLPTIRRWNIVGTEKGPPEDLDA